LSAFIHRFRYRGKTRHGAWRIALALCGAALSRSIAAGGMAKKIPRPACRSLMKAALSENTIAPPACAFSFAYVGAYLFARALSSSYRAAARRYQTAASRASRRR